MVSSWLALVIDFVLLIVQHFLEAWFTVKYIRTRRIALFCLLYVVLYTAGYALFEYFLTPYKSFKAVFLPLIAIALTVLFRERSLFRSILYPVILHILLIGSDYLLLMFFSTVLPEYIEDMMSVAISSTAPLGSVDFTLIFLMRSAGVAGVFVCSSITYYILRGEALDSDDKRMNRFLPVFAVEMVFTGLLMYFTARTAINFSSVIWLMFAFMAMFLILDVLVWNILRSVESAEQLRHEKAEIAICAQANAAAYNQVLEGNTRFRMLRHDMLNQLQTAALLLDQGKTEAAAEEIRAYSENIRSSGKSVTGNGIVDAVLSIKETTCKASGITLDVTGKLPETTPLNHAELCSVVGNILDNSIRSTSGLLSDAEKNIRFSAGIRDDKLVISCKNPSAGAVKQPSAMPKLDSEHGWGLHILEKLATAHNGSFTLTENAGRVTALFWIPCDTTESKQA